MAYHISLIFLLGLKFSEIHSRVRAKLEEICYEIVRFFDLSKYMYLFPAYTRQLSIN